MVDVATRAKLIGWQTDDRAVGLVGGAGRSGVILLLRFFGVVAMKFSEMSPAQQATLVNFDKLMRRALLSSRATIAAMQIVALDAAAISGPVLGLLDADASIPTECGLPGVGDSSKTQYYDLLTAFGSITAVWNTDAVRLLHAGMVGAVNIDGSR